MVPPLQQITNTVTPYDHPNGSRRHCNVSTKSCTYLNDECQRHVWEQAAKHPYKQQLHVAQAAFAHDHCFQTDMLHWYAMTVTTRTWHLEMLNRMAHGLAFLQGVGGLLCLSVLLGSRLLCRRLLYVWQRCRHLSTQCCMPFALCPLPGTYPTACHRCSMQKLVRQKRHWL